MKYSKIKDFSSKKNSVFLATDINNDYIVVKNFSNNSSRYNTELKISNIIYENNIKTPKILTYNENQIVYEYINGEILIDYIDCDFNKIKHIFDELIVWLKNTYQILNKNHNLILGDAHLRNFIYKDNIYGIDFENVCEGIIETDIASLIVFILTYNPEFTQNKIDIAKYIFNQSIIVLHCNKNELNNEISKQIEIIENRRHISISNHPIWNNF